MHALQQHDRHQSPRVLQCPGQRTSAEVAVKRIALPRPKQQHDERERTHQQRHDRRPDDARHHPRLITRAERLPIAKPHPREAHERCAGGLEHDAVRADAQKLRGQLDQPNPPHTARRQLARVIGRFNHHVAIDDEPHIGDQRRQVNRRAARHAGKRQREFIAGMRAELRGIGWFVEIGKRDLRGVASCGDAPRLTQLDRLRGGAADMQKEQHRQPRPRVGDELGEASTRRGHRRIVVRWEARVCVDLPMRACVASDRVTAVGGRMRRRRSTSQGGTTKPIFCSGRRWFAALIARRPIQDPFHGFRLSV